MCLNEFILKCRQKIRDYTRFSWFVVTFEIRSKNYLIRTKLSWCIWVVCAKAQFCRFLSSLLLDRILTVTFSILPNDRTVIDSFPSIVPCLYFSCHLPSSVIFICLFFNINLSLMWPLVCFSSTVSRITFSSKNS